MIAAKFTHRLVSVSFSLFSRMFTSFFFCIYALIFPWFCFSHFFSSFHIPFLSSRVTLVRKEDEHLNYSLSPYTPQHPHNAAFASTSPHLSFPMTVPFVYLLTPIHLFYLHPPPHTASVSFCPLRLLLSTASKIQRESEETK